MIDKNPVFVVIVPAYNEAGKIKETLLAIRLVFPELVSLGYEPMIYVVDDGSSDATATIALEAGADRIIRHKVNRGLGAAVRSGLSAARTDGAAIVVKFDADLQHDPKDIMGLIEPIAQDEAEIVYGHRFQRISYRMPLLRRIGNATFTRLTRYLTGWPITDSQPGIFAVSKAYLDVFNLPGDYNYTQQIILDAFHKGMRFTQRDVAFRERKTGKSFVTIKYPIKVLPQLFWVIVGVKPMKIFAPIGVAFLLIALGVTITEIIQWLNGETQKPVLHVNMVLGSMIFGLQTLFFGILAELIIQNGKK